MKRWEDKAVEERDKARETAFKDSMTGAKSKLAYLQHEKEINRGIDEGIQDPFAVVVCDVNGLKKLGCAYVQGYYFSKPVPTEEFDRFLAERSENG